MKTIIYSVIVILSVFIFISCDDKDDSIQELTNMAGDFEKAYFQFEYPSDSIQIKMSQGQQMSFAVKDIKTMFLGMANQKMGSYFKGVAFMPGNKLSIAMSMADGSRQFLHADYIQKNDYIGVTLDADDMKVLMGDKAVNIPSISFQYEQHGNELTMYFNKVYIGMLYAQMEDMLIPMVVKMMGVDTDHMPENIVNMIIASVKEQISGILNKTTRLDIGFVLKLEEMDIDEWK